MYTTIFALLAMGAGACIALQASANGDFRKNLGARRLGSLLGNGLVLSEGEFWLRQRRLMQPAFHRQRIGAMAEAMVGCALAIWLSEFSADPRPA